MMISTSCSMGRVAYLHDMRKTIKNNVDVTRIDRNIVLVDELKDRTLEEFTNDEMQVYIDEYNSTQKRKDRIINDKYCDYHLHSKSKDTKLAYEIVMQYGEQNDLGKQSIDDIELRNGYERNYRKWFEDFKRDYPALKVLWAVIHFDEATPHLHLAFQPRAAMKNGVRTMVGISRALEQCGIERCKSREDADENGYQLTRLFKKQIEKQRRELYEQGFELKEQEHGREHLTTEVYINRERALKEQKEAERKAKNFDIYRKNLEALESSFDFKKDESEIQRVEVNDGLFKKKEVIQMSVDKYDEMRVTYDVQKIKHNIESLAERQKCLHEQTIKDISNDRTDELKERIKQLKEENEVQKNQIHELEKNVGRLTQNIIRLREFLTELNLIERFKIFAQNYIKREEITHGR